MNKILVVRAKVGNDGTVNSSATLEIRKHLSSILPGTETLISITPFGSIAGGLDILPLEKILQDLKHLETLSGVHIEITDVNQVLDLLNELSQWLPYAGRIQANCKYYWRAAESNVLENIPAHIRELSTSERTRWIKSKTAEHESLYEQAERTVAAITHRCDHLRTFISYEKAMTALNNVPTGSNKP